MGIFLGLTAIVLALFVGISIMVIVNHNIRSYDPAKHVLYSNSKSLSHNEPVVDNLSPKHSL